jgi:hypothetical protein
VVSHEAERVDPSIPAKVPPSTATCPHQSRSFLLGYCRERIHHQLQSNTPTIRRNAINTIPFLAESSIGCDRKPALMQAHCAGAASAAAHHHDTVVLIDPRGHHLEQPLRLDPATRQFEPGGREQWRRDQAEESKAGNCGAGAGEYQCYEHPWWQ